VAFIVERDTDVRLVDGLSERFDLTVVVPALDGRVRISQETCSVHQVVMGPFSRAPFATFVTWHLLSRWGAYDFVVVQGYGLAALAANVAARLGAARVAMLVCSPTEAYYRCRQRALVAAKPFRSYELGALEAVARLNARLGVRYVVLSRHLEGVVRSHGARGFVARIPVYGVDTARFRPSDDPIPVKRRRRGLPEMGTLLFFSSRIAPEKDAESLLDAVRLLRGRGRDVRVLHRSGGYREFIKAAQQRGIADLVIATDAVHPDRELYADYQACDACVQASREEGLGFSPLEALACGVPVVASAVGGLRETIRDGETGWTYPVGDVQAMASAIEDVIDRPEEAARRATLGRSMVEAEYSRHCVFDMLDNYVRRIITDNETGEFRW
jgi:glycosyltransferase involved in cell wall biosynthesis